MNREDEKYYNDYFDLFRSDGWKQLTEELTQNAAAINNVAMVKDAEDLFFRQVPLHVFFQPAKHERLEELVSAANEVQIDGSVGC